MREPGCPLCEAPGGVPVFQGRRFRVIRADEPGYPAFYRLVWSDHVREFSELAPADRAACVEAVAAIEGVLLAELAPAKVNLATLGNMVPHLHWHVIARFEWDPAWPAPVWAAPQRGADPLRVQAVEARRGTVEAALREALAAWS